MSVTIRLAKFGKRNAPTFKVVAAQTRDKRNGKFLDILGYYNPQNTPEEFSIDKERFNYWKGNGALVTSAVEKLIAGEYEFKPYEPNISEEGATEGEVENSEEGSTETVEETPTEEAPAEETPKEETPEEEK